MSRAKPWWGTRGKALVFFKRFLIAKTSTFVNSVRSSYTQGKICNNYPIEMTENCSG